MYVPPDGPVPAVVAIVGEAPSHEEVEQGRGFVGPSGKILWDLVKRQTGLSRDEVYVSNVCKEPMPDEDWRELDPLGQTLITTELLAELREVSPRVVLAVGARAARALAPDFLDMRTHHGIPLRGESYSVVPVWHPAAALRGDATALPRCAWDLRQYDSPGVWARRDLVYQEDAALPPECVVVAIDTEGSVLHPWCLTWAARQAETVHAGLIRATEGYNLLAFAEWLRASHPTIVLHNSLHDIPVLRAMGVEIAQYPIRDTMIRAFHRQVEPQGLKALAARYFGVCGPSYPEFIEPYWKSRLQAIAQTAIAQNTTLVTHSEKTGRPLKKPREVLTPEAKVLRRRLKNSGLLAESLGPLAPTKTLDLVPEAEARRYAIGDAVLTLRLEERLPPLSPEELDHAVIPMFERMTAVGIRLDQTAIAEALSDLMVETERALTSAQRLSGIADFNPASGDQVAAWCKAEFKVWGTCGLSRMTRDGARESTDDDALQAIKGDHPLVPAILAYRGLQKMRSFFQPLVGLDRLRPNWRLTKVDESEGTGGAPVSGRVSTSEPNILAYPARGPWGKRIRRCFVADPGHVLMSFDYSQIEPRLAGILSGDERLLDVYRHGRDIYTETARALFNITKVDTELHRLPAKITTLSVLYGIQGKRLFERLIAEGCTDSTGAPRFDLNACYRLIERWFDTYSGVRDYAQRLRLDATNNTAAATTMFSDRPRFLPALWLTGDGWPSGKLRAEAERQLLNHRIQGTAADVMKRAQARVWAEGLPAGVEPLLQIHDDLTLQVPVGKEAEVRERVVALMTADSEFFPIPLRVDVHVGHTWADLKG